MNRLFIRGVSSLLSLTLSAAAFATPPQGVYRCDDPARPRLLVSFYNDATPPAVLIVSGDERVVAQLSRSASGSRYLAEDLVFWEHQGEATVEWAGDTMRCVATNPEH